jgi:Arm DNA-binding domain
LRADILLTWGLGCGGENNRKAGENNGGTGQGFTAFMGYRGFGLRVTAAGSKSFILNYRRKADGLERRWTIGAAGDWTTGAAREEAKRLKRLIDGGADPVGEHNSFRASPTVGDLCDRFADDYFARLRASTGRDYETAIRRYIKPAGVTRSPACRTAISRLCIVV